MLAGGLVAVSLSGATAQPPEPIDTAMPGPHFEAAGSGPFALHGLRRRARPLGADAPPWARRLYWRSLHVLIVLTDPRTGGMIAGEREGWGYVWPRDAAAGAIALQAAGLHPEARRVAGFLSRLDLDGAARFRPDGSRVPGRTAAGDGAGWVEAAERAVAGGLSYSTVLISGRQTTIDQHGPVDWRDRQDYGENVTDDLLGNAIAAEAPAPEILGRFDTSRGLVREEASGELDSSVAWAVTLFPQPVLRPAVRRTLLEFTRHSTPYGIPPMEGGRGLDRAHRLVGLGPGRARSDPRRGPSARGAAPRSHPRGNTPGAGRRRGRPPDIDHAARLVARLRDPRPARPLPRVARGSNCDPRRPGRGHRRLPPCAHPSSARPRLPPTPS